MARVHVNPEFITAFQTHILLVISGHLYLRRCFLCQKQLQESHFRYTTFASLGFYFALQYTDLHFDLLLPQNGVVFTGSLIAERRSAAVPSLQTKDSKSLDSAVVETVWFCA